MQSNFQESIETSDALIKRLETGELSRGEAQAKISELLANLATARGFFVSALVGEWKFEENLGVIVDTIRQEPGFGNNLLVKNLVMSSATAVAHRRGGDDKLAAGSDRVIDRSARVISELGTDAVRQELGDMTLAVQDRLADRLTAEGNAATFGEFLVKWKYDKEQLEAILTNLQRVSDRCASSAQTASP